MEAKQVFEIILAGYRSATNKIIPFFSINIVKGTESPCVWGPHHVVWKHSTWLGITEVKPPKH